MIIYVEREELHIKTINPLLECYTQTMNRCPYIRTTQQSYFRVIYTTFQRAASNGCVEKRRATFVVTIAESEEEIITLWVKRRAC